MVSLLVVIAIAQNYQCNWSVIDQGGGLMSSTGFRALPSVGQTAIGIITSTNFQGFIGFWQIDTAGTGIREEDHWSQAEPLVTALHAPWPNPGPGDSRIRYSLAIESRVSVRLFDLAGRSVAELVSARQPAGRYELPLSGNRLAAGVYFLKMTAGEYRATRKLVVE
jgi:hypothetical protein